MWHREDDCPQDSQGCWRDGAPPGKASLLASDPGASVGRTGVTDRTEWEYPTLQLRLTAGGYGALLEPAPATGEAPALGASIALETTVEKPATSSISPPRVHKLDDRLDGETVARIVAEYGAGASSAAIGSLFQLSKKSVIKVVLREAGIKVRYPG